MIRALRTSVDLAGSQPAPPVASEPLLMASGAPFQFEPGLLLPLPGIPGCTHWNAYPTYDSLSRFYCVHIFLVIDAGTQYRI